MQLLTSLLPHQVDWADHAETCFRSYGGFGALCDMGVGKTRVTIEAFYRLWKDGLTNAILIIAPGMACDTWQNDELTKHTTGMETTFRWDSTKAKAKPGKFDKYKTAYKEFIAHSNIPIFIVNIEAFQNKNEDLPRYLGYFYSQKKVFCIVDESSSIKSILAERSVEVIQYTRKAPFKTILTGTELSKSLTDIYPQMEFLFTNFWCKPLGLPVGMTFKQQHYAFRAKLCIVDKRYVSETRQVDKEFSWTDLKEEKQMCLDKAAAARKQGRHADAAMWDHKMQWADDAMVSFNKNLDRVNRIIAPYVWRVKKKDTGLNLPEKVFQTIHVDLSKNEDRLYRELNDDLMTILDSGEVLTYQSRLVLFTKFRQITGGWLEDNQIDKVPSKLAAMLSDIADTDEQVIVWANYTNELKMIAEALSKIDRTSVYYGGINQGEERDRQKQDFMNGHSRFIVINPGCGAYSMNLQMCTLQFWYDLPTQLQKYLQGLDRSHRIGVKNTCVYKSMVSRGTVDERVKALLDDSVDVFDRFQRFNQKEFLELVRRQK